MNKLLCRLLGHRFLYNFKSMPNKAICSRCKKKWYWNFKINEPWIEIDKFQFGKGRERSDEQLIKDWIK